MNTRYTVYSERRPYTETNIRTLVYDVPAHGLPKCAWCHVVKLRRVADVITLGVFWQFVDAICYCELCQMSTIVRYEVRRKLE